MAAEVALSSDPTMQSVRCLSSAHSSLHRVFDCASSHCKGVHAHLGDGRTIVQPARCGSGGQNRGPSQWFVCLQAANLPALVEYNHKKVAEVHVGELTTQLQAAVAADPPLPVDEVVAAAVQKKQEQDLSDIDIVKAWPPPPMSTCCTPMPMLTRASHLCIPACHLATASQMLSSSSGARL